MGGGPGGQRKAWSPDVPPEASLYARKLLFDKSSLGWAPAHPAMGKPLSDSLHSTFKLLEKYEAAPSAFLQRGEPLTPWARCGDAREDKQKWELREND